MPEVFSPEAYETDRRIMAGSGTFDESPAAVERAFWRTVGLPVPPPESPAKRNRRGISVKQEVLALHARGLTVKLIADTLELSDRRVRSVISQSIGRA